MRSRALLAAVALIFAIVATTALAQDAPEPQPGAAPAAEKRTRVGKKVITPRKQITLVRKFTPDATPTPQYVRAVIIPHEAARWGVSQSWLYGRISCETGGRFEYWAHNPSGASGLAQFMPSTWTRALRYWSREVRLVRRVTDVVRRKVVLLYSDGSRNVVRGRAVRRRVTVVRKGLLPRWPSVYHGWASVRGAARAMAGLGAVRSSEWSCR
jgi:hypothetical protein